MSCIRSCYDKDSSNFGHDDCPTCIHKDSPPQRTWVDLSRNEILEIINAFYKNNASEREVKFARLIQEAAKEKNA